MRVLRAHFGPNLGEWPRCALSADGGTSGDVRLPRLFGRQADVKVLSTTAYLRRGHHQRSCTPAPSFSSDLRYTLLMTSTDTSKPYIPLSGLAKDGWSNEDEATATCFCAAVQLAFVCLASAPLPARTHTRLYSQR